MNDTNLDGMIQGELSVSASCPEIRGSLAPDSSGIVAGTLSVPEKIIPSNYGLITWNGSVLTVS